MFTKEQIIGFILGALVAVAVYAIYVNEVGATNLPFHTEWVNKGQPKWGSCVPNAACGTSEGTQEGSQAQECKLVQGSGSFPCAHGQKRSVEVSRSCEVETPVCEEEPVDTCESEEGIQENGCTPEEPETPPVVKKDKKSHGGCEDPSKPQGFRFQFQGSGNLLKWEKKGSWEKVDIAVFGMDKTTLLYNIRTADDGEHLMPTKNTWHKIRGVNKCGLGEWSKLIN